MTQQQIANAVGITKSTYCGYETGKRQPDIEKLRRLALLLCTSVDELMGLSGSESEYIVSPGEYEIIKRYRSLDAHGQRMLRLILEEEQMRMRNDMRAIAMGAQQDERAVLPISSESVSGEPGAYLGPDSFHSALVRREAITSPNGIAAYAVPVRGTSLMPRFRDGDLLLIAEAKPHVGDVGLFILGGLGFVRVMGYGELLSTNPAYLPIPMEESIRACGTVIGVLPPGSVL